MAERDRDAGGRPRNARLRDSTGKPLARTDSPSWRDRLRERDEATALPPAEAIDRAEELVLAGQPFYAHEVLEGPWHLAEPDQRAFWQGLAQLTVGLTHIQRGNAVGAVSLLRSAAEKLRAYPDQHEGVAVGRLVRAADALADRLARDGTELIGPDDLKVALR